ncbi:Seg1p KNAG_0E02580 [Huiozyma naganishii CBS 8797]|uniref:Eisosome protein SEG1 n=1 Tax=Huiozyma naganishii (strain ATCC MYA-139 / BCRC 22969 / CBS 8797 / KCTC 17520 / NBRC 10181 / NCYC 3082 / Yp74L-3) TaxID=1071383 RepID=J7RZ98_HUIN7|nr:hypothetical protein KNAG_0E02580 [Kazachstania naganishii CBS 8797]CCK70517.1 hypothetical protein KNAG_0E02580 [Kazachstania naganishii CBS 8797]
MSSSNRRVSYMGPYAEPVGSDAVAAAAALGKAISPNGRAVDYSKLPSYNAPQRANSVKRLSSLSYSHMKPSSERRQSLLREKPRAEGGSSGGGSNRRTSSMPSAARTSSRSSSLTGNRAREAHNAFKEFGGEQTSNLVYQQQKPKMVKKYIPGPYGLVAVEVPAEQNRNIEREIAQRKKRASYSLTGHYPFSGRSNSMQLKHQDSRRSVSSSTQQRNNSLVRDSTNNSARRHSSIGGSAPTHRKSTSDLKKGGAPKNTAGAANQQKKKVALAQKEEKQQPKQRQYDHQDKSLPMIETSMREETELELELEQSSNSKILGEVSELDKLLEENIRLEERIGDMQQGSVDQIEEPEPIATPATREEPKTAGLLVGNDQQGLKAVELDNVKEDELPTLVDSDDSRVNGEAIPSVNDMLSKPDVDLAAEMEEKLEEQGKLPHDVEDKQQEVEPVDDKSQDVATKETQALETPSVKNELTEHHPVETEHEDIYLEQPELVETRESQAAEAQPADAQVEDLQPAQAEANIEATKSKEESQPTQKAPDESKTPTINVDHVEHQDDTNSNPRISRQSFVDQGSSVYDDSSVYENDEMITTGDESEEIKPIVLSGGSDDELVASDELRSKEPDVATSIANEVENDGNDLRSDASSYKSTQENMRITPLQDPDIPPMNPKRIRNSFHENSEAVQDNSYSKKGTSDNNAVVKKAVKSEKSMAGYLRSTNPYLSKRGNQKPSGDGATQKSATMRRGNSSEGTSSTPTKQTSPRRPQSELRPPGMQQISRQRTPIKSALKKSSPHSKGGSKFSDSPANSAYLKLTTAENTRLNAQLSTENLVPRKPSRKMLRPSSSVGQTPPKKTASPAAADGTLRRDSQSKERTAGHAKHLSSSNSKRASKLGKGDAIHTHARPTTHPTGTKSTPTKPKKEAAKPNPALNSILYPKEPPQKRSSFERLRNKNEGLGFKKQSLREAMMAGEDGMMDGGYDRQSNAQTPHHSTKDDIPTLFNGFSSRFQDSDAEDEEYDESIPSNRGNASDARSGGSKHKSGGLSFLKSKMVPTGHREDNHLSAPQHQQLGSDNQRSVSKPVGSSKPNADKGFMRTASVNDSTMVGASPAAQTQTRNDTNTSETSAQGSKTEDGKKSSNFGKKLKKLFGRKN